MTDQPTPDAEARATLIAELRNSDQRCVDYETTNCREQCDPISDWCGGCMRALLVDLLAAEGWRDISTAEESDSPALLALEDGRIVKGWLKKGWFTRGYGYRGWHDAGGFQLQPTHWMPLPAPPGGTR